MAESDAPFFFGREAFVARMQEKAGKFPLFGVKAASGSGKSSAIRADLILGEDISEFVSADHLCAEAEQGLAKAITLPECVRKESLPQLCLRGGRTLPTTVTHWWATLAVKLKQPGGNALLDLYLELLEPDSAQALGLFALRSFIAYDTVRPSEADALAYAEANINQQLTKQRRLNPDATYERVFASLRAAKIEEYPQSANDEKGVLALAVWSDGGALVEAVQDYIIRHSQRVA